MHVLHPSHRQQGLAAIEFALIASIMVLMLLGSLVYWRSFQAQQSLTRAAGDGARAALSLITSGVKPCRLPTEDNLNWEHKGNQELIELRVKNTIVLSLMQSGMPGKVTEQLSIGNLEWGSCQGEQSSARFELIYTLTPLLEKNCSNTWFSEPCELHETSTLHFATML